MIRSEKVVAMKDASTGIRILTVAHDRSRVLSNATKESKDSKVLWVREF